MLINCIKHKCVYRTFLKRSISVANNANLHQNTTHTSPKSSTQLINELADAYDPSEVERRPLVNWFFQPTLKTPRQFFTMLLPPPNITGTLHLGHALTATIQDVIVKWKRMNGIDTLWIPGMDHAGIATQVIVEKKIWAESRLTRHDIGRDEFEREVWKWKSEKSNVIAHQLRRLGVSLDWYREFFTMDEQQSKAVAEAFWRLHEDGLIYESDALVNWSCSLQSAISDIEVEHMEIAGPTAVALPGRARPVDFGHLTEFAYQLAEDRRQEVVVATTRPETMLGDVALAVHPNDARHAGLIGKHVLHPFRNALLPIIADAFVDVHFGTGVVKITPAHNHNDFEVGRRHCLPMLSVLDEKGRMINCGEFDHLDRFDAREKVLSALEALGLLRARKAHAMSLPICGRSKDVVELLMKPQWFLDCRKMAEIALENVRQGKIRIEPKHFEKTWETWLENIRPWCISRQLWWGHRIPAYRAVDSNGQTHTVIARNRREALQRLSKLGAVADESQVKQVDDVLDTWFSSGLLPLSALDWPSQAAPSRYPLDVMETGHDILFFWVARMAMLCTHLSGRVPFTKVLLHGVVCDAHGKKMSKSLGNVIAPEDIIEGRTLEDLQAASTKARNQGLLSAEDAQKAIKGQRRMFPDGIHQCGGDALRFTLCSYNFKNHFVNFDVQECKTNKFFGNKLWQATKFTIKWRAMLDDGGGGDGEMVADSKAQFPQTDRRHRSRVAWDVRDEQDVGVMDKWILSRLNFMLAEVNEALRGDNFHVATAALKNFLYYDFCDVYLESTKRGLREGNVLQVRVLEHCLRIGLRTLAPFMPYLSQHLYAHLADAHADDEYYPTPENRYRDAALEGSVGKLMDVVIAIRRLKRIFNVTAKHQPKVIINTSDAFLQANGTTISDLSACAQVDFNSPGASSAEGYIVDKVDSAEIRLHVPTELRRALLVDAEKLAAKRAKLAKELEKLNALMAAPGYAAKVAPASHANNLSKIAQLEQKIMRLAYVQSLAENRRSAAQ